MDGLLEPLHIDETKYMNEAGQQRKKAHEVRNVQLSTGGMNEKVCRNGRQKQRRKAEECHTGTGGETNMIRK